MKRICPKCGKEITPNNYERHIKACDGKVHEHQHLDHEGLNCKYCGKLCKNKNSLIQHEIRCKENSSGLVVKSNLGYYNQKGRKA
jgi:DNA-directed RNA polymerase subunit RPC12/RpoP